jgi:enoyl-CoA hydratase/carnithine racemase
MELRTEIVDRVAIVTIDRPPVNSLAGTTFREITETFRGFATSKEAHVAILTAAGDRAFCGGVDLNDSARRHAGEAGDQASPVDLMDPGAAPRACFESILDCAIPVIGAINAAAVGAGVALAACCDVLVASTKARFALTEINAGVLGGGRHLQRLVGAQKARLMMFTGDFVGAEEFHRIGAIESVVEPAELLPAARAIAERMAAKSPIGLRLAKESLNRVEDLPLRQGYRTEQDYTLRVQRFDDSAEARKAFLEKRDPEWRWG